MREQMSLSDCADQNCYKNLIVFFLRLLQISQLILTKSFREETKSTSNGRKPRSMKKEVNVSSNKKEKRMNAKSKTSKKQD